MLTKILAKLTKLLSPKTSDTNVSMSMSKILSEFSGSKIDLYFRKQVDLDRLMRGTTIRYVRLFGDVSFRTKDGWTEAYEAIIDTGSTISFMPRARWEKIEYHLLSRRHASHDIAGETVAGRLGIVTLRFHDTERISVPLNVKMHLLDSDSQPLVLGFEDILTELHLVSDFVEDAAYLGFKNDE